jgi:superfamily II DNA or RNA helicase
MAADVVALRDGSLLRLRAKTAKAIQETIRALTYTRIKSLSTWKERQANDGKPVLPIPVDCYSWLNVDGDPWIITNAGYTARLKSRYADAGITCVWKDKTPPDKIKAVNPRWKAVEESFKFRAGQRELLQALVDSLSKGERCGQIIWATGTGKSEILRMIARLLGDWKILITTKYNDTLKSIYARLQGDVSGLGIYCSKAKRAASRVLCCSSGCLRWAVNNFKPDLILCDEIHELATDQPLADLALFKYVPIYGLSANYEERRDKRDFELKGLAGEVISCKTYEEGVADGSIVPIEVHWLNCKLPYKKKNPAAGRTGNPREKHGVWRNEFRNQIIADAANAFDDEEQVLITVKTVEHALHLKKLLPQFQLVHGKVKEEKQAEFEDAGLAPKNYDWDVKKRDEIRKRFERGKLRKVIATSVWKRGVNFLGLSVLIRADRSSTKEDCTQIPGRLSRVHAAGGKTFSVLIDLNDEFDGGFELDANRRRGIYRRKGWAQFQPDEPDHIFRRGS